MLIANHLVKSWQDGQVKEFKAGEEVTGLSEHDERELKKCGALTDTETEAMLARRQERIQAHATSQFEHERDLVMAAKASITPPASEASTDTTSSGDTGPAPSESPAPPPAAAATKPAAKRAS